MKIGSWGGIVVTVLVLYFGVFADTANPKMFLDTHAVILVLGGTLAAGLLSLSVSDITRIVDFVLFGLLEGRRPKFKEIIEDIRKCAESYRLDPVSLSGYKGKHPFITEACSLILEDYSNQDLAIILKKRKKSFVSGYKRDARAINNLAKYPPAFGLLGATTGMIAMMSNLGSSGTSVIGQAMAIALVATFWGIALANFVLLPMADHATQAADQDSEIRDLIIEGFLLIRMNTPTATIMERLRSGLPIKERVGISRFGSGPSYSKVGGRNAGKTKDEDETEPYMRTGNDG